MKGLSLQSVKQHPSLIPLYVCVGAGCLFATFYTIRLATKNPDVTWNRKTNPEPWNEYSNKQYKFYSPIRDYSKIESPAPKYDN
ncbi:cytochrome c oxidase subunit NDUFA4 [Ischnura elegans]|uniref:cytochrome c oxidase subunit NDUFA4 n=1 Tax=Ischnura elegans TaxID=197161 RepID=UPI001ED87A88|nr:cytochrome c oxidase subunit NDUFA4 [Ischnura elegans]